MSQERLAPQQAVECLILSRVSSCKGGTLVASDVWTLSEHRRRVSGADGGYRRELDGCPGCGHPKLHVHDYRERKAREALAVTVVRVVRFICVNPRCRATWQVLPAFLARHLWWTWSAVEQATAMQEPSQAPEPSALATAAERTATDREPSARTRQRWLERLKASAAQMVELIKSRGGEVATKLAGILRGDITRADLVECYAQAMGITGGRRYAEVAALMHDLERGIRLM